MKRLTQQVHEFKRYEGGCHCGAVHYSVDLDLIGSRKAICNCSRCEMLGFLHCHASTAEFKLESDESSVAEYRFGTGRARHLFCRTCGVESFYYSRSDPDLVDINLRCLRGVDIYSLDYWLIDGRNWERAQGARREAEEDARVPILWRLLAPRSRYANSRAGQAFFDSWH